jgi:hypothetical protein
LREPLTEALRHTKPTSSPDAETREGTAVVREERVLVARSTHRRPSRWNDSPSRLATSTGSKGAERLWLKQVTNPARKDPGLSPEPKGYRSPGRKAPRVCRARTLSRVSGGSGPTSSRCFGTASRRAGPPSEGPKKHPITHHAGMLRAVAGRHRLSGFGRYQQATRGVRVVIRLG